MHLQTIRLGRVFDVKRDPLSRTAATNFSFETEEGRRCLAVQLPGHPRLEEGDRVVAVLGREGNWHTLLAWKNLANGEVIVRASLGAVGWLRVIASAGLAVALWLGATTDNGRVMSSLLLSACGLGITLLCWQQWRAWQARRLLDQS